MSELNEQIWPDSEAEIDLNNLIIEGYYQQTNDLYEFLASGLPNLQGYWDALVPHWSREKLFSGTLIIALLVGLKFNKFNNSRVLAEDFSYAATSFTVPCGNADVDGSFSQGEWDNAVRIPMYRAGENNPPNQPQETWADLLWQNDVLYGRVVPLDGVDILQDQGNAYIKIAELGNSPIVDDQSGDDGSAPDFQWVMNGPVVEGLEMSGPLPEGDGSYTVNIHAQVFDDNLSQTSAVEGRGQLIVIGCEDDDESTVTPTNTPTSTPTEDDQPTATSTSTPTSTPTEDEEDDDEPTSTPTATNTPANTETSTPTPTNTPTSTPVEDPEATATSTSTVTPTNTPIPTVQVKPTAVEPTLTSTPKPPTVLPEEEEPLKYQVFLSIVQS